MKVSVIGLGYVGTVVAGCLARNGHDVVGVDKSSIKARIRELKTQREAALAAHDRAQLKVVRRTIHRLKRRIHKATV